MKPEVILALDVKDIKDAEQFVDKLYPKIKIFKVGSQLFTAYGPRVVEMIRKKGAEVFLDLKFFDIPNTVANAVAAAVGLGVKMMTLHILGDEEMLKSAVKAADEEAKRQKVKRPLLIGVTVLTSREATSSDVLTLAKIGIESGLDGVVSSVVEVTLLKQEIKKKFVVVTPGIRSAGAAVNDQKRTATVRQAAIAGSDYLVVGRPILSSADPLAAAEEILGELDGRTD